MRGLPQLLANVSGRCAAFFMKAQLYFLALEKARLEKRYASDPAAAVVGVGDRPKNVVRLLPPIPGPHRVMGRARRSRDYVA